MATSGPNRQPRPTSERTSGNRRAALIVVAVVLVLGVAGGAFFFLRGGAGRGFAPLTGRWFRLDGGYVLEIRGVDAAGKMDASYLNPRPINVAKAQAMRDGSTLKVFVELQASGYPGSTYTLTYDPTGDQLCGVYYQAVLQQRFDVCFVRTK
jgi:hypothetical protein